MKKLLFVGFVAVAPLAAELFDPFAVKESYDLAVSLEALYWQAMSDQLGYAIRNQGSTSVITKGSFQNLDSEWNWGFRAGVDYKLPHDRWDMSLDYTYFQGKAHGGTSAPSGGAIFPVWQYPTSTATYTTGATAEWTTTLNEADLELGRRCLVGTWLSIRPFMGVKGVVLHQRYHANYSGGSGVPSGDTEKVKMHSDAWGVGLRVGFNSLWGLGQGISLYGDGAASLLGGNLDIHQKDHLNIANITRMQITDNQSQIMPVAEIALGLQWDTLLRKDRYHIGLKLGWEFNCFFNQNQFIQFLSNTNAGAFSQNNGDLSFMGITGGFRLDF